MFKKPVTINILQCQPIFYLFYLWYLYKPCKHDNIKMQITGSCSKTPGPIVAKQSQPTARKADCSAFWTSVMRGPERPFCQNCRFLSNETAVVPPKKEMHSKNVEKFQAQGST
jgi:hypothetical protein